MDKLKLAPWQDEDGVRWLHSLSSWPKMAKLIQTTLQQDPRRYPHQIRAAASMVILLCREEIWPHRKEILSLYDTVGLARRQLGQVKHLFSVQGRINKDLIKDRSFRSLLDSMDDELRMLESRMSDPPMELRQEPPSSWAEFWAKDELTND